MKAFSFSGKCLATCLLDSKQVSHRNTPSIRLDIDTRYKYILCSCIIYLYLNFMQVSDFYFGGRINSYIVGFLFIYSKR